MAYYFDRPLKSDICMSKNSYCVKNKCTKAKQLSLLDILINTQAIYLRKFLELECMKVIASSLEVEPVMHLHRNKMENENPLNRLQETCFTNDETNSNDTYNSLNKSPMVSDTDDLCRSSIATEFEDGTSLQLNSYEMDVAIDLSNEVTWTKGTSVMPDDNDADVSDPITKQRISESLEGASINLPLKHSVNAPTHLPLMGKMENVDEIQHSIIMTDKYATEETLEVTQTTNSSETFLSIDMPYKIATKLPTVNEFQPIKYVTNVLYPSVIKSLGPSFSGNTNHTFSHVNRSVSNISNNVLESFDATTAASATVNLCVAKPEYNLFNACGAASLEPSASSPFLYNNNPVMYSNSIDTEVNLPFKTESESDSSSTDVSEIYQPISSPIRNMEHHLINCGVLRTTEIPNVQTSIAKFEELSNSTVQLTSFPVQKPQLLSKCLAKNENGSLNFNASETIDVDPPSTCTIDNKRSFPAIDINKIHSTLNTPCTVKCAILPTAKLNFYENLQTQVTTENHKNPADLSTGQAMDIVSGRCLSECRKVVMYDVNIDCVQNFIEKSTSVSCEQNTSKNRCGNFFTENIANIEHCVANNEDCLAIDEDCVVNDIEGIAYHKNGIACNDEDIANDELVLSEKAIERPLGYFRCVMPDTGSPLKKILANDKEFESIHNVPVLEESIFESVCVKAEVVRGDESQSLENTAVDREFQSMENISVEAHASLEPIVIAGKSAFGSKVITCKEEFVSTQLNSHTNDTILAAVPLSVNIPLNVIADVNELVPAHTYKAAVETSFKAFERSSSSVNNIEKDADENSKLEVLLEMTCQYNSMLLSPLLFPEEEDDIKERFPQSSVSDEIRKSEEVRLFRLRELVSTRGVLPPPSVTMPQLTCDDILRLFKENMELSDGVNAVPLEKAKRTCDFRLQHVKQSEWPYIRECCYPDIYYNNGHTSEEFELLCLKYKERYVGNDTTSSCNAWFTCGFGSEKKRKCMGGPSPGRRLSHLASRRRQMFSKDNLFSLSAANREIAAAERRKISVDAKKAALSGYSSILTKISTSGDITSKVRHKRALFQSPDDGKKCTMASKATVVSSSKTFAASKSFKRALFSGSSKSVCAHSNNGVNLQLVHESDLLKKTPAIKSVLSSTSTSSVVKESEGPTFCNSKRRFIFNNAKIDASVPESQVKSKENENTGAKSYVDCYTYVLNCSQKKKLMWAFSEALKSVGIGTLHPSFRLSVQTLGRICKTSIVKAVRNSGGHTSEIMLQIALQHVSKVVEKLLTPGTVSAS